MLPNFTVGVVLSTIELHKTADGQDVVYMGIQDEESNLFERWAAYGLLAESIAQEVECGDTVRLIGDPNADGCLEAHSASVVYRPFDALTRGW